MTNETQTYVAELTDGLFATAKAGEVVTAGYQGEQSDFVRFNGGRVRQAGTVEQHELGLRLVRDGRQALASVTLSGVMAEDAAVLAKTVGDLRELLPHLPQDPHLLLAEDQPSTEHHGTNELPTSADVVTQVTDAAASDDLVGIYAAGTVRGGFASSTGQRNWFETHSYNLDWSLYHQHDKAVKTSHAGFQWEPQAFLQKMEVARMKRAALAQPAQQVPPGRYRVFLSPAAIVELMGMLAWGGFSMKSVQTKQTPLLRLVEGTERMDPRINIDENTAGGIAPAFQEDGFARPDCVSLIRAGKFESALISPRSAKEYGVATNGASASEIPESYDVAGGSLEANNALQALGDGIMVGNLWYLNWSDRPACRTTGMTRFATFLVEGGEIKAPLDVMRFDETIYRVLGENLVDLTAERELILDADTYGRRSTTSYRLPGALVEDFAFTL